MHLEKMSTATNVFLCLWSFGWGFLVMIDWPHQWAAIIEAWEERVLTEQHIADLVGAVLTAGFPLAWLAVSLFRREFAADNCCRFAVPMGIGVATALLIAFLR